MPDLCFYPDQQVKLLFIDSHVINEIPSPLYFAKPDS